MLGVALESEFLDPGLTQRAVLPAHLRALVTADVDVLGREDVHDLGEDILQEGEGLFLAYAKDIFGHAPAGPDFVRTAGAAQFRIGGEGGDHVAGEVDLRDDGDVALGGIGHDLAHLLLGVEAAVADAVVGVEVLADAGSVAPGTHFRELGVLFDLHAPALVLGEVPVEAVEFVGGGDVDIALGLLDAPEVTAGIQVDAAVVEARGVQDASHRGGPSLHGPSCPRRSPPEASA